MIDENLRTRLVDLATAASARIYTGTAPQQPAFPLVVLRRNGGSTPQTLRGVPLFSRANVTLSCIGKNYAESISLANAIRDALTANGGKVVMASSPAGTDTTVLSCRCTSEPTDISEADGDLVLRGISQEFLFVYLEA